MSGCTGISWDITVESYGTGSEDFLDEVALLEKVTNKY